MAGPDLPPSLTRAGRTAGLAIRRRASGWLAAVCLLLVAHPGLARSPDAVETESRALQGEWASVFYEAPREQRSGRYKGLLDRVRQLRARYPGRAEPLIVEAIILCTYSASALGLDTLDMLEQARVLLQQAIDLDPPALDGAAYVTLGNLYRRLPGWPILYGDKQLARQYLEAGLRLYPDAIDTNYFYGEYHLDAGDMDRARHYLGKASHAPIRESLRISDLKLKEEADRALAELRAGRSGHSDFFGLFTPAFDGR